MRTRWLPLGLLVALSVPACKRDAPRAAPDEPPAVSPAPAPAPATSTTVDTVDAGWQTPEAARLSGVQYTAPTKVFGVLGVALPERRFDSIGPGYKIGTLIAGPYRGADLVSARFRTDEPCKGEGCDDPMYLRLVRVAGKLVFLARNSDVGWSGLWPGAFSAEGPSLVSDSQFAVPAFLAADTILHDSETFRLVSRRCKGDSLKIAFRHAVFHAVRSSGATRPASRIGARIRGSRATSSGNSKFATMPLFPTPPFDSIAMRRSSDTRNAATPFTSSRTPITRCSRNSTRTTPPISRTRRSERSSSLGITRSRPAACNHPNIRTSNSWRRDRSSCGAIRSVA